MLTLVTAVQGQMADALPLFDRALAVTQADPALTDLRLLLQINKAVTLGGLDRYEEAFAAARQARHLADRAGTMVRLAQAHSALGQLLFDTGRWDDAMAEVERPARRPEGARRGLLRSWHRRRDLLPSRRDHRGAAAIWPRPFRTPSGSGTGWSARWRWPAAWTSSRTARYRGTGRADPGSPTSRRSRGDRGPAC